MKQCNKCSETKPSTEFKTDPRNKDGLQGICKACNRAWQKQRRDARASGAIPLTPKTIKKCNKCEEEKEVSLFYRDVGCADGLSTLCKICRNKSMANWRDNNREAYNASMRKLRSEQKDMFKNIDLKRTYGITLEQYTAMLTTQNGVCLICSKHPQGKRPLVVDHNHATGAVRGLLCYGCNRALHVLETKDLLEKSSAYLEKFKK